jgi:hypothetical protein
MPEILTPNEWDDYLSDEVRSRSDLSHLVQRAEWYVVDRYREDSGGHAPLHFDYAGAVEAVQLRGWATDADGNPDTSAMDAGLLERLRMTVAELVEHWHKLEDTEEVESISQGNESVTFRDKPEVPSSAFAPLRPYDERRLRL